MASLELGVIWTSLYDHLCDDFLKNFQASEYPTYNYVDPLTELFFSGPGADGSDHS